ncbi:Rho GTPase activating protein [Vermiconidia calcicola]|uniref:Rho GTPase activating protein n=1 Tax=Vermiconidia calcicola TaxID=1690605 RepID=A0ACC3NLC3_9PEZI|nr:Rho GTPase activating protein [Vermiconidia calcicola]
MPPLADGEREHAATSPLATPSQPLRAPNAAKRVPVDSTLDDFRSAVTRDALREEARRPAAINQPRKVSAPVLAGAPKTAPPMSPNMSSSSSNPLVAARADPPTVMPRNPSIDSTVSTASQKVNGTHAYRVTQESNSAQDVAALIAAAGSPENAIQKLINDKNQAASHNAQLWRLVEKQRAMILGLNKDLERSLKEKDRYRRKLKDSLVQSESAPSLMTANQQLEDLLGRETSQSPVVAEDEVATRQPASMRDFSLDSRKVSDASDAISFAPGHSNTPQDTSNAPSSILPATPLSATSANAIARDPERVDNALGQTNGLERKVPAPIAVERMATETLPISPEVEMLQQTQSSLAAGQFGHRKNLSAASTASPPPSAKSFSSPKTSRKAPPAPLDLTSKKMELAPVDASNDIIDASDSEYEDDPSSARAEKLARGRRKTREEDDREREAVAQQEWEHRSRSKKDKKSKSKSKSKPPAESSEMPSVASASTAAERMAPEAPREQMAKIPPYQSSNDPTSIIRQRALSDAGGLLPRSITAPTLMSPGLPMSPRPGDRPMNSPQPRPPIKMLNSMPMSPKSGIAGLPLSPRAPRQPIPMPPQTPLSLASPHLARAEAYQQPAAHPSSLANQLRSSPSGSPEYERPSTSSDPVPMTPGEIYRGLVTEQYPDLLLPPNALPSIYIKTASSRMRPSRLSYIASKASEENPVFTLAVHERSDNKQLWRVEKTLAALASLDEQIKAVCAFRDRLPEKSLFTGHAPAKIDARRVALDGYFSRMLDSVIEEKSALVVCKYLSTDALGAAEARDYFGGATGSVDLRPDTPVNKLGQRPRREGFLTKRGKNFGGWKARYFILDGPIFKYFDSRGGAQLGSIKLQNAQIGKQSNHGQNPQEDEDNQFRHAFLILEPKKKDSSSLVRHVLCAESDEERDIWVEDLLQYVDYRDDEDDAAPRAIQPARQAISGARSPRLKQSYNDLRPPSRNKEGSELKGDTLRAVGYNDTVAGDAPVIGPPKADTPSPPYDANFGPAAELGANNHPNISGPTNLQVISNASDWGMATRPSPTPQNKDKKRSIFAGFRGRSSSDLAPNERLMSPGLPPQDHYATGSPRAVFGVPLAEAVEFARPADVGTELPAVVYRCIEYLLAKNALAEEGIFRLSGSNTVIKGLKDRFNNEGDVNLTGDGKYYDIHAVASLLKLYLRELPSSILTRELHLEFLQCLEMHGKDKVIALNVLVHKLPGPNKALLDALSSFLLSIVNNAEVNKMNVRNVGIVFAPTLNVPAPLISSFVEDQSAIFGQPVDAAESPTATHQVSSTTVASTDLRSPRKQMFSDLPTPAYNQTTFQPFGAPHHGDDNTGMIPMQPTYAKYQMAPQGDGGYGSLNDALRSPTVYNTAPNGVSSSREAKSKRRESTMLGFNLSSGIQKKSSKSRLREEEGASF